jgi:hypothetical protein
VCRSQDDVIRVQEEWRAARAVECSVRYLKAALVALVGGFLFAVAVTTMGGRRCELKSGLCHYTVQTGGREVLFALGFVAVFAWFVGGRRRLLGL